jgi:hypothetical protein
MQGGSTTGTGSGVLDPSKVTRLVIPGEEVPYTLEGVLYHRGGHFVADVVDEKHTWWHYDDLGIQAVWRPPGWSNMRPMRTPLLCGETIDRCNAAMLVYMHIPTGFFQFFCRVFLFCMFVHRVMFRFRVDFMTHAM